MRYTRNDIRELLQDWSSYRDKEAILIGAGLKVDHYDAVLDRLLYLVDKAISDDEWLSLFLFERRTDKPVKVTFDTGETVYLVGDIDSFLDMLVIEGFIDA